MSNKIQFKKCPECKEKMQLKKSRTGGGKFWGCTKYPDCTVTVPHHGNGARAGLDLNIREIENGYIISIAPKFADSADEDEGKETHCGDKEALKAALTNILTQQIDELMTKVETTSEFIDEANPEKAGKRAEKIVRGETDIKALIKKMNATKERIKEGEVEA